MKNKLYRVLVMLLVVAMAIPAFALAEDLTITPTEGGTYEQNLLKVDIGDKVNPGMKFTVANIPEKAYQPHIEWTSSNKKVVAFDEDEHEDWQPLWEGENFSPRIILNGVGEAKITGTVYLENAATTKTFTYKVNLKKVDVKSIKFSDATPKKLAVNWQGDLYPDVVLETEEGGSTFGKSDIVWSITEGEDCATLDANGRLKTTKAGKVTVSASIPGSEKGPATATIEIIADEPVPDPDKGPGYESLRFTQKGYTIKNSSIELNGERTYIIVDGGEEIKVRGSFLTTRPRDYEGNDSVVWSIKDDGASIATITNHNTGKIDFGKNYGKVTVIAHSKFDPTVQAECTVERVKGDEKKDVETITFNPTTVTISVNQTVDVADYATITPYAKNPDVVYVSADPEIATKESEDSSVFKAKKEGEVKINAYSASDRTIKANPAFTIKVVKAAKVPFEKLEFAETAFTFKKNQAPFNLNDYLVKKPADSDDTPVWTSTDPSVVSVNDKGILTINGVGTAEIKVRNVDNTVQGTNTVKITVEKATEKPITKLVFAQTELTVKESYKTPISLDPEYLVVTKPDGSDDKVIYTSSDNSVVSVDDKGKVSIKGVGTAEIKVRNADNTVKGDNTLKVTVVKDSDAYTSITPTEEGTIKVPLKAGGIDVNNYFVFKGNESGNKLEGKVWTSDNQQIAYIPGNDGKVKFEKAGTVKITVRNKIEPIVKATITLEITDEPRKIEKIELTTDKFELKTSDGDPYLRRYVVYYPTDIEIPAEDELIFTSDDKDILDVDENGTIIKAELCRPGTAHITVRSKKNPEAKAQFTITHVKDDLKTIKFVDAPKQLSNTVGKDDDDPNGLDLSEYLATDPWYYATDAYAPELYWEVSDPQVATVSENGWLYFQKPGTVTVKVGDRNGKATPAELTIEMVDNEKVTKISVKSFTMKVGETVKLTDYVKVEPLNLHFDSEKLFWISSDRHVAESINVGKEKEYDPDYGWFESDSIVALEAGKTKLTAFYKNADGTVVQSEPVTVTVVENSMKDVRISKNQYTLKLNTKTSCDIKFNTVPFDAKWETTDVYVESSDPSVVAVTGDVTKGKDNKGEFTVYALKPGAVKITVYSTATNKALDVTKVVVKKVAVKSAKLPVKEIKLYWYDDGTGGNMPKAPRANRLYQNEYTLTPIVMPSKAYYKVSYETSDPSVAFIRDQESLGSNGDPSDCNCAKIVASGEGKCKITVKISDGKKVITKTLKVVVLSKKPAVKMSKSKATIKMVEGGDNTLQLRAYNADTDKDVKVTWTTSDKKVAKVNAKGVVTAVGAGKAVISATTKDNYKITVTCTVTVKADKTNDEKKVAVKEIEVAKKTAVKVGAKKTLEVNVKPAKATNKNVSFKSSDPSIVTVDKNGKIKGISAGEATITITAKDGSGVTAKVKVIVKK